MPWPRTMPWDPVDLGFNSPTATAAAVPGTAAMASMARYCEVPGGTTFQPFPTRCTKTTGRSGPDDACLLMSPTHTPPRALAMSCPGKVLPKTPSEAGTVATDQVAPVRCATLMLH